ncbi:hypothetical protein ABEB36_001041 [Hypothenemus hampei]|uniref:Uncharacterized protein n=1 Tax=Hypothenemus hampei TaxID=57062 RepID=A0ABD1FFW6_HYPHA
MGNCFGCLPSCKKNGGALCNFNFLSQSRSNFSALLEEKNTTSDSHKRSFLPTFLQKRKYRQKMHPTGIVDNLLKPQLSYRRLSESQRVLPQSSYFKRDIQLQCLDARALLRRTSISSRASTPTSSLDLEWEHETLPVSSLVYGSSWTPSIFPEDVQSTQKHCNITESDCSRVSSSANSLEWDSVQNSVHSDVDTDTQYLLNEIDRLTMKALKETGVTTEDDYLDDAL